MEKYLDLIQEKIEFIESSLDEDITVKQVAENGICSNWQFQRVFRGIIGDSIGNYLRHRRLTKCAWLLQNTDQRIIDIAIEYQFGSQEAFTRSFKKYFSCNPSYARKNGIKLQTKEKPVLTMDLIEYLSKDIQKDPQIITRQESVVFGLQTILFDVYSKYQDYNKTLTPLWKNLFSIIESVPKDKIKSYIGLLKFDEDLFDEEKYSYMAAIEVSDPKYLSKDLQEHFLPKAKYAVFTNEGFGDKTSFILNYVYGIWLPQTNNERASGDEFEIFDNRYKLNSSNSISDFYLPIK